LNGNSALGSLVEVFAHIPGLWLMASLVALLYLKKRLET